GPPRGSIHPHRAPRSGRCLQWRNRTTHLHRLEQSPPTWPEFFQAWQVRFARADDLRMLTRRRAVAVAQRGAKKQEHAWKWTLSEEFPESESITSSNTIGHSGIRKQSVWTATNPFPGQMC